MTGLQFRMLNTKRGPSVWAPRAQCDKKAYQFRMKWVCERQPRLDCKQGQTAALVVEGGVVTGVETTLGVRFLAKTVVITTGTFLRGLMHVGESAGGRSRRGERGDELARVVAGGGIDAGEVENGDAAEIGAEFD